jgi:hypothetical protein
MVGLPLRSLAQGLPLRTRSSPKGLGLGLGLGACLLVGGCAGEGTGRLAGTLFLRGCPPQDPTPPGSSEVPSPLPAFALDPVAFYGEVVRVLEPPPIRHPGATIDRIRIRLQRSTAKAERTDVFELIVPDIDRALLEQAAALGRGEPGFPVLPPPVAGSSVPLPKDPFAFAHAGLQMHGSCEPLVVQPQLRGYVRFNELGRDLGQYVDAEINLTVEDARAIREQGAMPQIVDTAGALSGTFRFQLRAGPAVTAQ